jgi:Ca2+-binding RTX toxin-like protein
MGRVIEPAAEDTLVVTATSQAPEVDPAAGNNAATASVTVTNTHGCTIMGTTENDIINGTDGNDVICTFGGNDHMSGGNGNDTIDGQDGNDTVEGGNGTDTCPHTEQRSSCT